MEEKIQLKIKRLKDNHDVPLPEYQTDGSSGMDIRAAVENIEIINPGEVKLIPTGISIEVPIGFEVQVRPRSSLAAKFGITVLNSPGTIDSDYRGEVKIILINHSSEPFEVNRGDRIAQLIVSKYQKVIITEIDELSNTERGEGGFGSTGMK